MAPLIFTTPRCHVGRVTEADRGAVRALFLDAEVRRHLGGPVSCERADAVAEGVRHDGGGGARAVRLAEGGPLVGLLFLSPHHDEPHPEVSYLFAARHWGRGLATEVVGALLDRARSELGLRRIVAETQAANLASRRVLVKVGMRPERRLVRFGEPQVLYATARRS